ncbi:homeobox-domain-containing protein [Backusella circina FSU 941]|nr:homeobox-domain-containing protein [Backusella circina FSU 941]
MYEGYTYPEGDFRPTFYNPFEIKHRRRTSRSQLKVLEKSFSENSKPNATVRRILAQQLGMTPRGVQIWFQNRRAKAKLQKRKSGFVNDDEFADSMDGKPKLNSCSQSTSSTYSSNNAENKQSNARNVATAAAVSCIFDSDVSDLVFNDQQQCSIKMEEWLKLPIHPLAPVIEGSNELDNDSFASNMSAEEWRRKSCPALGTKNNYFNIQTISNENYNIDAYLNNYDSDVRWTLNIMSPLSNRSPIDFNHQSLNCSPTSQQMTPMLSTCSPNSVHGQFDPSCLDFIVPSPY